jgi:mono/diheme cytochrome c family protein
MTIRLALLLPTTTMAPARWLAALRAISLLTMKLLIFLGLASSTTCLRAADFTPTARKFLDRNCAECHDADVQKGNLRVDQLSLANPDRDHINRLVLLFDRVQAGEMPPKKADQPTPEERNTFLAELRTNLIDAETKAAGDARGRSTVRRMNRVEYESTLRDLLGLPLLRVKDLLPEDGQQFGFDKVAGALDLSHIHMSKYFQAADVALRQAIVPGPKAPESKIWREPAANQGSVRGAIAIHCAVPLKGRELAPGLATQVVGNPEKNYGNTYRAALFKGEADSVAVLTGVIGAHQPEGVQIDRFKPSVPGWYRVKFSTWSLRWERTKAVPAVRGLVRNHTIFGPPYFKNDAGKWEFTRLQAEKPDAGWMENIEFYGQAPVTQIVRASLKGEPLGYFDAPSLQPKEHEFKVWLNPGEKVSFHAMTLPATGPRNSGLNEGVRSYEGPGVAYDWFEVEGPLVEEWPPASQRTLFGDGGDDAQKLLARFATQAFRRPLAEGELASYTAVIEAELKQGTKFEEAMLAGYKAILCSPDFLMIGLESGVPPQAKLGDHALASRLSYFLWNSLPDATLSDLATKGELSHPATLSAQVTRMLADPRSDRFITHFLDEWLELKKIDFTTPDPNLYPEYDPWLHDSMLTESRATFRRMLTQNLGVREIIASDTLLINQRLAELYGIRGVAGSDFREVKVPADSVRGGFLTQAAVLKVTANGTATSPVLRGLWVLERILGIPRQSPPPNIPAIEPDATGAVTIRQMIEKHRADAACASCHAKMDPPGLALENFDAIGGWREHYRLAGKPKKKRVGKGKDAQMVEEPFIEIVSDAARNRNRVKMRLGSPVDASGQLADGRSFQDISGLRTLLLEDEDALARNIARQLIIYATGAGIRFSDREAIDAIVAKTRASRHGMRSILEAVVASELFQTK